MKIAVINGPNLNLLGTREPSIYGNTPMETVIQSLKTSFPEHEFVYFQSNHEGALIDFLQEENYDAIIINPGALSHYSIALADCLKNIQKRKIEVHISHIYQREAFRQQSVTAPYTNGVITGLGVSGYHIAVVALLHSPPNH